MMVTAPASKASPPVSWTFSWVNSADKDFVPPPKHESVVLIAAPEDITQEYATFSLMGPSARGVLSQVTKHNLENEKFPFC